MFKLLDVVQPDTLEEAYDTLVAKRSNTVLGGCAFLRMASKRIGTAIDLSQLNLNFVKQQGNYIEIGAMTSLREIETNPILAESFCGVLPKAVSNIIGVQFRNVVSVGASVFSKYGFSDLLTVLLALECEVELYQAGRMTLKEFLDKPYQKDILIKVLIKQSSSKASYRSLRGSASDFPILNAAVSCLDNQWTVVVGARPLKAAIASKASKELAKEKLTLADIEYAAGIASEELSFGTNIRGSAEYRKAMCQVLVKRAVSEVLQCK